jgi:hypothetical protein
MDVSGRHIVCETALTGLCYIANNNTVICDGQQILPAFQFATISCSPNVVCGKNIVALLRCYHLVAAPYIYHAHY